MNYYHRTAIESQGGKIEIKGKRVEVYTQKEIEDAMKKSEKIDQLNETFLFIAFLILLTLSALGVASIIY